MISDSKANFDINFLDHVAILVKDTEASALWYQKVLGLRIVKAAKWEPFPIFLLAGKTGIALFPANLDDPKFDSNARNVKIDHYAFNVSNENFKKALEHYSELGLDHKVKDHHYFHSVYIKDLDGHTVELTTLVVDESEFYSE